MTIRYFRLLVSTHCLGCT